jgi:hypothetical protein
MFLATSQFHRLGTPIRRTGKTGKLEPSSAEPGPIPRIVEFAKDRQPPIRVLFDLVHSRKRESRATTLLLAPGLPLSRK